MYMYNVYAYDVRVWKVFKIRGRDYSLPLQGATVNDSVLPAVSVCMEQAARCTRVSSTSMGCSWGVFEHERERRNDGFPHGGGNNF